MSQYDSIISAQGDVISVLGRIAKDETDIEYFNGQTVWLGNKTEAGYHNYYYFKRMHGNYYPFKCTYDAQDGFMYTDLDGKNKRVP